MKSVVITTVLAVDDDCPVEALQNLSSVMLVQSEDGVYSLGSPDIDEEGNELVSPVHYSASFVTTGPWIEL